MTAKKTVKRTVKPRPAAKTAAKSGKTPKPKAPAKTKTTTKTAAKSVVKTPRRVTKKDLGEPTSRRGLRRPLVVSGFVEFLREQSVVGLAIGLVIGTQVKALADQLIASFINPLIGLVLPGTGALDKKVFVVHLGEKAATFAWGSFVAVLLSFITTATVIYFVFKSLKLDKLTKKKEAQA